MYKYCVSMLNYSAALTATRMKISAEAGIGKVYAVRHACELQSVCCLQRLFLVLYWMYAYVSVFQVVSSKDGGKGKLGVSCLRGEREKGKRGRVGMLYRSRDRICRICGSAAKAFQQSACSCFAKG